MASTLGLDRLEGGYSQQVDTVLYSDLSPQLLCQSSLREAVLTSLEALAAAGPPATPEVCVICNSELHKGLPYWHSSGSLAVLGAPAMCAV